MAATLARCAHLLLQVDAGRAPEVARYLSALPEIAEAAVTSGPYDVIALVDVTRYELSGALAHARRAPGLAGVRVCRPA